MELIILKLVSKLQLLLTFCLSNHAKKRHLHIALASDQAATERFIEGEVNYRASKTGHENTWSYTGLDHARVPPPSEDDLFGHGLASHENKAIFYLFNSQ